VPVSVALVGPPGAGKTTLFNALTAGRGADGVGMLDVPDPRLGRLAAAVGPKRIVAAQVRLIDAPPGSRAQRIAAAREADVVVKVVRGFGGEPDPAGDLEGIELDLALTDLATVERRLEVVGREARSGRKQVAGQLGVLERAKAHLDEGRGLGSLQLVGDEAEALEPVYAVSLKPSVVVANVDEAGLADERLAARVREVAGQRGAAALVVAAGLEYELSELAPDEQAEMRESYGLKESGLAEVTREVWAAGGLITYFTAGEPEVRAWPCGRDAAAPVAAGVIHSDFEKAFIKAEVTSVDDLVAAGSMDVLRSQGKLRLEGKDYHVQDGDVMFFRVGR